MEESTPITTEESLPQNIRKAIPFDCTSVIDQMVAKSAEGQQKTLGQITDRMTNQKRKLRK